MVVEPGEVKAAIVAAEHRAGRRLLLWVVIGLIFAVVMVGLAGAGFVFTWRTSVRNQAIAKQVLHISEQVATATAIAQSATNELLDCTRPGGHCYQQAQTQTATAVRSLNDAGAQRIHELARKVGELAHALGVPQSTVDRILNEP
jgi:Tfp pilus assembly protein PilN